MMLPTDAAMTTRRSSLSGTLDAGMSPPVDECRLPAFTFSHHHVLHRWLEARPFSARLELKVRGAGQRPDHHGLASNRCRAVMALARIIGGALRRTQYQGFSATWPGPPGPTRAGVGGALHPCGSPPRPPLPPRLPAPCGRTR